MVSTTLRGWLQEIENMGELQVIEGADWDLEIGGLSEKNIRRHNAPALFFKKIKDYPGEYGIVTCSLTSPGRFAHTFHLPVRDTWRDLLEIVREKYRTWQKGLDEYAPVEVKDGEVMENVSSGENVNLYEFPAPRWHELDGGRYIGTGCSIITRDPDTKEINLGTYRTMLHDKNTVGLHVTPGRHARNQYEKYYLKGEKAPVAICLGQHPLLFASSASEVPHEPRSEYHFAGAVRGEPVKVIREEITGLLVPAEAEIVIAGWSPPGKVRKEGPFGEFTGYYSGAEDTPQPFINIERVYYRSNPIMVGVPPNRPPDERSHFMDLIRAARLYNDLIAAGVPDVKGVWFSDVGRQLLLVISIKQRYAGHARQALLASCLGYTFGRYIMVVDEDIDPSNTDEVLWALCTRTDPARDIDILREMRSIALDPVVPKPVDSPFTSRALINACKPYEWKDRFPGAIKMSRELEEKTRQKWGKTLNL
ncbi:MAG: UbiD family decarboxylase [Dehalococcoidia bacterium]|nr:UbiD family decarboxylase [Dehalococcoidia bacterium]MDZ4247058.1 UbiD family decarboxylase [Dehalococcoidia bacterium]